MAEESCVLVERAPGDDGDAVAIVKLNRPDKLNALSRDLLLQLTEAVNTLAADGHTRVLVLTGAGRAFCAGVDLTDPHSVFKGEFSADVDAVGALRRFPGPIIGAINGFAVTGGFELALACDVLLGAPRTRFADTHAKFGLAPAWGLSQKLSRLIGPNRAREMSFTSAAVDAETAKAWGLLNGVVDSEEALLPAALDMAGAMAAQHPKLLLYYKRVLNRGLEMPLGAALEMEREEAGAYYGGMAEADLTAMQEWIITRPGRLSRRAKL